ncbi:MAG: response regulator [Acetobacter sp.]|uniref:response regulator n=1 Tax=Acetobacter sp. TaxID=440 RepID=UPI0039E89F28
MSTLPETVERPVVLVVDDEPEILVALADLLEGSYSVLTASSGEEGLALLRANPDVAVMISDQRMPGMTGDVFFAHARELTGAGAILLTGYADISAIEAALNRGQISFFAYKPWDDETLLSMVGQAADRYRLENELARERLLLRGLLENLPFGLAFKDQDGCFIRLNQQMARQFGLSVADCLGRREEDLIDGARLESLTQAQADLAASGRDQQVLQLPGEDGQTRWHDLTRVRLYSLRNEPVDLPALSDYSILIDRDVTELLSLEQRLRQAQKMQAIGTLAGGIAHDFNNLLTAIQGSLELVQDLEPPREPNVARLYHNAMEAARRGAVLTGKLLDFSRPRHLSCQRVDVVEAMENLQGFMRQGKVPTEIRGALDTAIPEGNSRLSSVQFILPQDPLPPVWTDAVQLQLAVFSQCINALDAQPEGGSTSVIVRLAPRLLGRHVGKAHAEAWVVVQVLDRGVGMTEEMQARIFDPFFTTKDVGQGSGLGLSMIYGFISHCGGEVRVESVPGGGTSVEMWLPAMDQALAEAIPPQPVQKVRQVARVLSSNGAGEVILVVDDEPGVRAVTAGFLKRAGYDVVESASGADALEVVKTRADIALVVMDVMMPGMNGGEAARHIHALRPQLPVLFVTGYADYGLLPDGVSILHKPYTRDALLGDVRAMLAA